MTSKGNAVVLIRIPVPPDQPTADNLVTPAKPRMSFCLSGSSEGLTFLLCRNSCTGSFPLRTTIIECVFVHALTLRREVNTKSSPTLPTTEDSRKADQSWLWLAEIAGASPCWVAWVCDLLHGCCLSVDQISFLCGNYGKKDLNTKTQNAWIKFSLLLWKLDENVKKNQISLDCVGVFSYSKSHLKTFLRIPR